MAGQRLGPNTGNQMVVDWLAQAHLLLPLQVNLAVELSNQGVKFSLHGLVRGFSEASDPILQLPSSFSNIPNFRLWPEAADTACPLYVCFEGAERTRLLVVSSSGSDPYRNSMDRQWCSAKGACDLDVGGLGPRVWCRFRDVHYGIS